MPLTNYCKSRIILGVKLAAGHKVIMHKKDSDHIQQEIDKYKVVDTSSKLPSNGSLGFNIAVELISFGIIGILVGVILDHLFGTKAVFLVISVILSLIASLKLIYIKYIRKS